VTSARRFPCRAESVAAARRFIRDVLQGRPRELVEAAELMTSELATNCVRHAHSDFELAIHDSRDEIRVEVSDNGQGHPTLRSPTPQEHSGRGLLIVEELSTSWGTIPSPNGKLVWFTLPQDTHTSERTSQSTTQGNHESEQARQSTTHARPASGSPGEVEHRAAGEAPLVQILEPADALDLHRPRPDDRRVRSELRGPTPRRSRRCRAPVPSRRAPVPSDNGRPSPRAEKSPSRSRSAGPARPA
jgi:anti-sigma regulatory factor (Ser/Thr protein kinase)